MTKLDLQKELLEKIKPGTKPSDLKKQQIKPKIEQDEGYESDKSDNSIPTAPPLPNQTKDLQAQISSLQKQLQLYKDFRAADLKVKEKLKEENKLLKEKLANQTNPSLNQATEAIKPKAQEKYYLFTCDICDQNKKSQLHLAKVNGLGIDPTKLQKICDFCLKKVDLIQEKEDFF